MHESPCEELPVVTKIKQQAGGTGHSMCPMPEGAELTCSSPLTLMARINHTLGLRPSRYCWPFQGRNCLVSVATNSKWSEFVEMGNNHYFSDSNSVKDTVISKWITYAAGH